MVSQLCVRLNFDRCQVIELFLLKHACVSKSSNQKKKKVFHSIKLTEKVIGR